MKSKTALKDSYTKSSSKKWIYFNWLLLGLILFAGLGYATTVSDTNGVSDAPKINEVLYVTLNDGDDIQTKIDQCNNTNGGLIIIPNGVYEIDNTILLDTAGCTLQGTSFGGQKYNAYGSVLIKPSSSFTSGRNLINISGYRAGAMNLYINATSNVKDGISLSGGAVFLQNIHVSGASNNGITVEGVNQDSESWIDNVWSGNNGKNGLELKRADYRITGFVPYRNWYGAGIFVSSGANIITNSYIWSNKYGVFIQGGDSNIINSNIIAESLNASIYFDSSTGEPFRESIIGNTFLRGSVNQTDFSFSSTIQSGSTNSNPHIYFNDSSENGISSISMLGNNFDNSTYFFDYSGTGLNIEKIFFGFNAYPTRNSGNIPNNTLFIDFNNANGAMIMGNGTNRDYITFNSERSWKFTAGGSAGSTTLDLVSSSDGKQFRVLSPSGTVALDIGAFDTADSSFTKIRGRLQNIANATAVTCNSGNAGSIYYDGGQRKHLGCNSTTWNALY